MSILSDRAILNAMEGAELAHDAQIVIKPFDVANLGGNSYDVHLADTLLVHDTMAVYTQATVNQWRGPNEARTGLMEHAEATRKRAAQQWESDGKLLNPPHLDCAIQTRTIQLKIPPTGLLLIPGILYLGSTVEYTETHAHVPVLDGKSGVGRMGIRIHATAGRGDVGFCGHWTMEIDVVEPVTVYPGQPIGQLTFYDVNGDVERKYQRKEGASYTDAASKLPQPSRLWKKIGKP